MDIMNPGQSTENILEDENKCYICDAKFDDLELHFLNSHTSQRIVDKKEDLESLSLVYTLSNF